MALAACFSARTPPLRTESLSNVFAVVVVVIVGLPGACRGRLLPACVWAAPGRPAPPPAAPGRPAPPPVAGVVAAAAPPAAPRRPAPPAGFRLPPLAAPAPDDEETRASAEMRLQETERRTTKRPIELHVIFSIAG